MDLIFSVGILLPHYPFQIDCFFKKFSSLNNKVIWIKNGEQSGSFKMSL